MKLVFFDIEIYPNLFVIVFYNPILKEYTNFICWENGLNQLQQLKDYLKENKETYFVGYNSLAYDMNILTEIVNKDLKTNKQIKDFNDHLISLEWPIYREADLCNKTIDLMLINNYGPRSAKSTSLKKLEFNMRKKSIKDLPYHFNDLIDTNKKVEDVIKYCQFDVEQTLEVFKFSKDLIKLRIEFGELNDLDLLNSAEPDLGKRYIYNELAKSMNIGLYDFKKLKTYHNEIKVKDLILNLITFENQIYKDVLDFYNNVELKATLQSQINPSKKLISLKSSISKTIEYRGLTSVYGSGGVHGFVSAGVYESNNEYMITSFDFASYYPHLQFTWDCIAEHIPSNVYSKLVKDLFDKRNQYPKGTNLNYVYKILINLLYGS